MTTPGVALRRPGLPALVLALTASALTACASGGAEPNAATTPPAQLRVSSASSPAGGGAPATSTPAKPATSAPQAKRGSGGHAVLAFAGDVHFEGGSASALSGNIGSAFSVLRGADLGMVNLETAVTDRGTAQPKEFTFRAPAAAFGVLERAGVDVVTVANNHGMDYGRVGLEDTLAAAKRYRMPLLGAGQDVDQAFAPLRRDLGGVRVSILAATDVLDDFAQKTWVAGPGTPGLASAKDESRLLAAVRAERGRADVVVVFLHWGVERTVCPTARQRDLARQLSGAGADIVVGSHAHVVQPAGAVGATLVRYGLGNFNFYNSSGLGGESGVLTVAVTRAGVANSAWHPASIRGGVPELLTGAAATARLADEKQRFAAC